MKWTKNLRALFPCANESCAEEQSYEAADLFWVMEDSDWPEGWYCVNCISQGEPPGIEAYTNSLYIFLTRHLTNGIYPTMEYIFGPENNAKLSHYDRMRSNVNPSP